MKKFIFVLLALLIAPLVTLTGAQATPISKDMANAYYNNCKSQPAQGISEQSKDFLCACTAAKMKEKMTVEDVQAMSGQNPNGRKALNYMLVKVYAPCIKYPAKDHYYNTCISNPKTKILGGNVQKTCGCLSDQVAKYLDMNAEQIFAGILQRNPNAQDPMQALTDDPKFQDYAQRKLLSCIR